MNAIDQALEALHVARPHIQNWLDRIEKDLPNSGMAWQAIGQDLSMVDSAIHDLEAQKAEGLSDDELETAFDDILQGDRRQDDLDAFIAFVRRITPQPATDSSTAGEIQKAVFAGDMDWLHDVFQEVTKTDWIDDTFLWDLYRAIEKAYLFPPRSCRRCAGQGAVTLEQLMDAFAKAKLSTPFSGGYSSFRDFAEVAASLQLPAPVSDEGVKGEVVSMPLIYVPPLKEDGSMSIPTMIYPAEKRPADWRRVYRVSRRRSRFVRRWSLDRGSTSWTLWPRVERLTKYALGFSKVRR